MNTEDRYLGTYFSLLPAFTHGTVTARNSLFQIKYVCKYIPLLDESYQLLSNKPKSDS
jgi:hypothetical protein